MALKKKNCLVRVCVLGGQAQGGGGDLEKADAVTQHPVQTFFRRTAFLTRAMRTIRTGFAKPLRAQDASGTARSVNYRLSLCARAREGDWRGWSGERQTDRKCVKKKKKNPTTSFCSNCTVQQRTLIHFNNTVVCVEDSIVTDHFSLFLQ